LPKKLRHIIPKGSKDCKGIECTQDLEFELDVPETNPIVENIPTSQVMGTQQTIQVPPAPQMTAQPAPEPKKEEKKLSHEEIAEMIPEPVNFAPCPGGDCDHKKLENPKKTTKFVSCPHCTDNSNKKGAKFCKTCGKGPKEDEEDYWENSDIELEEEE